MISEVAAAGRYTGNGVTASFVYPFRITNQAHLAVYVDNVLKVVGTHYTVSGVGDATGSITFVAGQIPANGSSIAILRNQPLEQASDYVLNEGFPSARVEQDLDKLAMQAQMIDERIKRAIKLSRHSTLTDVDFPDPQAGKYVRGTLTGFELVELTDSAVVNLVAGDVKVVSDYASFAAAVTAIGATVTTLYVNQACTVSTAVTVPATLHIIVIGSGSFTKSGSGTLTINGSFEAPFKQVFSGFSAGDVVFGTGIYQSILPQWWGASPSATAATNSTAFTAAIAAGDHIYFPPGTYSISTGLTLSAAKVLCGAGIQASILSYTGSSTAITINSQYARVRDFKLIKSGSAGSSIGIEIATGSNTGHHLGKSNIEVTGFDTGVKTSRTFYANYYGIDSHDNVTYNWWFTNTVISVDLWNCSGRGTSKYGIRIDSTTANSSEIRLHGGTFEGASIQQIDIVGADRVLIDGTHVEPNTPISLTGTVTLTNGSTAMTGSGTLFTSELVVGQYVKLNADSASSWMRVESITNNTTATLSDNYQGTGGSGAAKKAAGGIRVANLGAEAAERCMIINPSMSVQSESAPAIYIQSGNDNVIMTGDASMPIILGAAAVRTQVTFSRASGGLVDLGTDSRVYGDPSQGQFYIKRGTAKAFQLWVSGSETELYSDQKLRLYVGGVNQLILDPGTAADEIGLQVKDYTAGNLKRVSRGAADSGGTGFRVLRVPN